MTIKNKYLLRLLSLSLLPIAAISVPAVILTSCSNKNNESDDDSNNSSDNPNDENNGDSNNKPDDENKPELNLDKIKADISSNFNKTVNTDNFNNLFLDYNSAINTICNLANDEISPDLIQDLKIINNSINDDDKLILSIELIISNNLISLEISTEVINPNSNKNLLNFNIDNNGVLTSLTSEGLKQTELIIPSTVKYVQFASNYAKNNIINAEKINFSFAREFIGFSNTNTFLGNKNIKTLSFEGCNKFNDWKQGTFSRMEMLESLNLNGCSSLIEIGKWGIDSCANLVEINLNGCTSLSKINGYAFENCTSLKKIDFSQCSEYWTILDISAFNNCSNLEIINFENISYLNTGVKVFSGCNKLSKILINYPKLYESLKYTFDNSNLGMNFDEIIVINKKSTAYDGLNNTLNSIEYNENAFLENAQQVANDDSVLYYSVNWAATLHRYGAIAHILKVLELNPNKEIHIIATKQIYSESSYDLNKFNEYPNVNLKWIDYKTISEYDPNNFNFVVIDSFINDVDSTKNNVLYTADFNFLYNFKKEFSINSINSTMKDNLTNTYFMANKLFNQINVLGDGTASVYFYNNNSYFATSNNGFNFVSDTYPRLIEIQKETRKMSKEEFRSWLDEDITNPYYYMLSSASASKNYNNDDITNVNYYVTYTNMIKDANNISSSILSYNKFFDQYYDPYNTLGMNFINFINSFKKDTLDIFCDIIKCPNLDLDNYIEQFSNSYNVVYGGILMSGDSTKITQQAERLIKLAKLNSKNANGQKLQIWYKGHPRDSSNYWDNLLAKINELVTSDNSIENKSMFIEQFKCLQKEIPIEVYLGAGIFNNYPNKNSLVKIYGTYSTYVLSLLANDMKDLIEKIIVSDANLSEITNFFGNDSYSFPSELLISDEELFS